MQVAGLQDFRQEGPPGDIGVFQAGSSIIVYQFTFSGVTYIVAQRMGVRGWILACPSNIDAATVIQSAINALGTAEGKIFIKAGKYTLSNGLEINYNVHLEGEGNNITQLILANNVNKDIITYRTLNDTYSVALCSISHIMLDGNSAAQALGNGISLPNLAVNGDANKFFDLTIFDVLVYKTKGSGISLSRNHNHILIRTTVETCTGPAIWIEGFADAYVTLCFIQGNLERGIVINNAWAIITCNIITSNRLRPIHLRNSDGSIVTSNKIFTNEVAGEDAFGDVYLENADNCTLDGNYIFKSTGNMKYGIRLDAASSNNTVVHNNINGASTLNIFDQGANNIINHNSGYVTENRVAATITALNTSIAFAHGCNYTPAAGDIHATLTNLPTTPIGDIYVDTIGAVNATLHCTTPPGAATAIFDISIVKTP